MDAPGVGISCLTMNPAEKMLRAADRFQQGHPWLACPVAVWKKFGDDQAGNLAALIAYFAFVSIFPLLLVLATVLNIVLHDHPALRAKLINSALANYPVVGQQIKSNVHSLNQTGVALAIGIILIFLGARGVANAMQNALNSAWEVPKADRPGFPWSWLRSIALILVVGAGTIITSVLSGVVGGAGHVLPGFAVKIAATAVSLVLNIGMFWLGFRLAAASVVTWRNLRLGAVIAGCAWQILQVAGGYIIGHQLAHSSALYGTFGVVLGLIAWLYLQATATLYAAEINVVRARKLWPRSLAPPPYTAGDVLAYRLYAKVERREAGESVQVHIPGQHREDMPGKPAAPQGEPSAAPGKPAVSPQARRGGKTS
jgi:membrane protein